MEDHQESKKKVGLLALRIPVLILLALGAMVLIAFFAL
jgi:flagellar basal body-associated protein FliL